MGADSGTEIQDYLKTGKNKRREGGQVKQREEGKKQEGRETKEKAKGRPQKTTFLAHITLHTMTKVIDHKTNSSCCFFFLLSSSFSMPFSLLEICCSLFLLFSIKSRVSESECNSLYFTWFNCLGRTCVPRSHFFVVSLSKAAFNS